jgi:23S rRNA pseudouridine2604 synthase
MRINRYLTDVGYCSRREADRLIESGKVKINDQLAKLGQQVGPGDIVFVDGKKVGQVGEQRKRTYLMYHKPRGIICTTDTTEPGNIVDAIAYSERVFPIGRLDKDSTGLIFLTSDGEIVNKILRAQFGHEKEYEVIVDKPVDDTFLKKMSSGVDIGDHFTLPCKIKKINPSTFSLILTEGKNRQIRRMCEALGYKVRHLKRVRIMNVRLGKLKEGEFKSIPQDELKKLMELLSGQNNENHFDKS